MTKKRTGKNKVFLRANWLRMASANYIVDPCLLEKYLPKGTVLESYNGQHYVSLVAFRYSQTRLLNIQIPFYSIFEEINLRFYVKREIAPGKWRSEVAFTKLFFPKNALTLVAKHIYKENYETRAMRHKWTENKEILFTSYGLKKDRWHNFDLKSAVKSEVIDVNSSAFFFSKHYWGTSHINEKSCTIYEIQHPEWSAYPIKEWDINFDFNTVFGSDFKQLTNRQPESVHLFDGSEVVVCKKKIL